MTALSERQISIVRTLVQSAPDRVVGSLSQALADTAENSALGGVRRLVEVEVFDRTLRNLILQPVAPMCVGGGDDPHRMTFPSRALTLLWRGLCDTEDEAIAEVRHAEDKDTPVHVVLAARDQLTASAAAGIRAREVEGFRAAAEVCDLARPGGAELLAACLDMAPVVRQATQRLPGWLAHPGSETTAATRLAYRDAVETADDAGPRFFQMLAAQMTHPWMVLRVISAVMDKPTERYLADSELAGFGEALLSDIDATLTAIAGLKADAGPATGRSVAKLADLVVQQMSEIETSIDLDRELGWGQRVHRQRASLASVVEGRFRETEKALIEALPTQAPRDRRIRRQLPRLTSPPEERLVARAMTLLSFCDELKITANYGGFSATRNKLIDRLGEYLDHYVDELLDLIRTEDVEDLAAAAAFLRHAADFNQLLRGDKAGDLVRRRTHAVLQPENSHHTAG